MRKQKVLITAVLITVVTFAASCTSVSRGLGKITANKYAEPRSGTVWVVPPPQLEPPKPENKNVYISFRNISDAQSVNLTDELRDAAREQGWNVVSDPYEADYRLRASLRYFGEVKPESGGTAIAKNMGVISGAAVGVGTGALVANATDNWAAGAAVGVGAGGLIGQGISNASKPREWAMIIDFVLEEYSGKQVEYELMRNTGAGTLDAAGTGNSRMAAGGGTSGSNTSSGSITKKSHYFPHGMRLSAWANQMNMKKEEALPLLKKRTRNVVTNILPR
ncbi:complement resistance protein TraT [Flexistipes sp.]|uniref:complement resistance protein TraT n=1 Tax=Flexistipes sp. TaxID=3088135 RepID=UPI002E1D0875|nr:complement resistance protein TraT [Flexistipes sp.]